MLICKIKNSEFLCKNKQENCIIRVLLLLNLMQILLKNVNTIKSFIIYIKTAT